MTIESKLYPVRNALFRLLGDVILSGGKAGAKDLTRAESSDAAEEIAIAAWSAKVFSAESAEWERRE